MASKTIEAAGGIVMRKGARGLIAVVQRSKDDAWVLPRGKLKRDENPIAAARREVIEETGHRVDVHEYVGAITYRASGRPKVVQFWRMEADREASHELMKDIVAVEWLPLKAAVRRLSYPLEKLFLRHAAARAVRKRRRPADEDRASRTAARKTSKSLRADKAAAKPVKSKPVKPGKGKERKTGEAAGSRAAQAAPRRKTLRKAAKPPRKADLKAQRKAERQAKRKSKARAKDKAKRKPKEKGKGKGKRKGKREAKAKSKASTKSRTGTKIKGEPKGKPKGTPKVKEKANRTAKKTAKKMAKDKSGRAGASAAQPGPVHAVRQRAALPLGTVPSTPIAPMPAATAQHAEPPRTILQRMLGRLAG